MDSLLTRLYLSPDLRDGEPTELLDVIEPSDTGRETLCILLLAIDLLHSASSSSKSLKHY